MNLYEAYLGLCDTCGADLDPVTPLQVDDSSDSGKIYVWAECSYSDNHDHVWAEPEHR